MLCTDANLVGQCFTLEKGVAVAVVAGSSILYSCK
eukprot:SAG22_NODE_1031_length_5932_cov_2.590948_5_plen_34_part_01